MEIKSNEQELVRVEAPDCAATDPMQAVLDAVSAASGRPVLPDADAASDPLPPLYDAIDPDAFNTLVRSARAGARVTFDYAGFEVTVTTSSGESVDVEVA